MRKNEIHSDSFVTRKVEVGESDFAATAAGWKWSRRCPVTGRFVKAGTMFVTLPVVFEGAVEEWHNVNGESHAFSDCAGHGTVTAAPTGWLCCDCVEVEVVPRVETAPRKMTKGLQVLNLLTTLTEPMTVKQVAQTVGCSVGRVNEVKKELGLRTVAGFLLPA